MNPHKVFFIDPQGGSGNLGRYDYELVSRLAKEFSVFYFCSESYNYKIDNKINYKYWFKYKRYAKSLLKGISYVLTMFKILIFAVKKRPAIVHVQWIRIPRFDIVFYTLFKRLIKIRLVYTVHNILPHDSNGDDWKEYKRMYDICDALMVHTEKTKVNLIEQFNIAPEKIFISPHGPLKSELDMEEVQKAMDSIIEKYKLQDKLVFSLLGYQSAYKGTDLLIKAWNSSEILSKSKKSVLIVGGKDANLFAGENTADNLIFIDGKISNTDFEALMKISDVIVMPYRKIEQSGVLLSIIPLHKPYCTTDVGELKIPIVKENIGWIIPEISTKSIKNILEHIELHPDEIAIKSNDIEGWSRVAKLYDWDEASLMTKKAYLNI